MKPIILLFKLCKEDYWYGPRSKKHNFQGITQELHDKCIEDLNYIELRNEEVISEEKYSATIFYKNLFY